MSDESTSPDEAAPEDPRATMDLEQHRGAGGMRPVTIDVELQIPPIAPGVDDVPHPLDLGMPDREGREELAPVDRRGEASPHVATD